LLDFHARRPSDHDGATRPLGALFYYFRLDDQVAENHLVRLIEKHIRLEFVRDRLRDSYSETGRPSIDPALLLLAIGMGSPVNASWWKSCACILRGGGLRDWASTRKIPHHSTFSKNRRGRFQEYSTDPVEEPVYQQDQVSTTDPDSTYATKCGMPARMAYYDNYLVDNHSCVIVGVQATAARMSQETVAAQAMAY
jgi:hypothetical protein